MRYVNQKITWVVVSSLLFLTMCRSYEAETVEHENGLSCKAYTDFFMDGSNIERGNECKYTCPNGLLLIASDSLIPESRKNLDAMMCGIEQPTARADAAAGPPTPPARTPSPTATRASAVSSTPAPVRPLLSEVTTCNAYLNFINFRFIEPRPSLEGRNLVVTVDRRESVCRSDPAFPSILTCSLPQEIAYPAEVLVSLDGARVNTFRLSEHICHFELVTSVGQPVDPGPAGATPGPTLPAPTPPAPTELPVEQPTQSIP